MQLLPVALNIRNVAALIESRPDSWKASSIVTMEYLGPK